MISFKTKKQEEENRIKNLQTLRNLLEVYAKPKTEELNKTVNNLIETYKITILLNEKYRINTEDNIKQLPKFYELIDMDGKPQLKDIYGEEKDVFIKGDLELFKKHFPDAFNKDKSNDQNNNNFQYFLNNVIDSIARFTVGTNQHPDLTANKFDKREMYINRKNKIDLMNNKFENLPLVNNQIDPIKNELNSIKDGAERTDNVLQKIKELKNTINKNNLNQTTKEEQKLLNKYNNTIKDNKRLLTEEEAKSYNKNINEIESILRKKLEPKSNIENHNQTPVSSRYKN